MADGFIDMMNDEEEAGTTPEAEVTTGSSPFSNADFGISTKPAAPEANKPAPESNKPAPEANKPATEANKSAPEANKPAQEASKPASGEVDINNLPLAVAFAKLKKGIAPNWGTDNAFDTLLAACIAVDSKKYAVLSAYDVVCVRKPNNFETFDEFVKSTSSEVFSSFKALASVGSIQNADDTAANAWLVNYAKDLLKENAPDSNDFKELYEALANQIRGTAPETEEPVPEADEFERLWRSDNVQVLVRNALDTPFELLYQVYSKTLQRLGGTQGVLTHPKDDSSLYAIKKGSKKKLSDALGNPFTPIITDLFSLSEKELSSWNTSHTVFKGNDKGEKKYEVWFHYLCASGCIPEKYDVVCYEKDFKEITAANSSVGTSDSAILDIFKPRLKNFIESLFYTYFYKRVGEEQGITILADMSSSKKEEWSFSKAAEEFQDSILRFYILHEVPSTQGVFELQYCLPARDKAGALSSDDNAVIVDLLKARVESANKDTAANMLYKGLNILYSGASQGIEYPRGSQLKVYSIIAVADAEYYALAPSFAYKPIRAYITQGKEFSYKNVLLGKSLANTDVFVDLSKYFAVSIYAASRSGKGVMTLSILASLLASEGVCFTYGDYKPEMSTVFWSLTRAYQKQFPEINPRFLSCEFYTDPATKKNTENYEKYFGAAGFDEVPYGKSWTSPKRNPSLEKFKTFFGISDENFRQLITENNLFGILAYMKYIQLCYFCANSRDWGDTDLVCILDEYTNMSKANRALYSQNSLFFKVAKSITEIDKKDSEATALMMRRLAKWEIYFVSVPATNTSNFAMTPARLADKIDGKENFLAGATRHIRFVVIGQQYKHDMTTPVAIPNSNDFFSFFNKKFLQTGKCLRVQGNYPSGNEKDINDLRSDSTFWDSSDVQASLTGYNGKSFIHEGGTEPPSGYWYLHSGEKDNLPAVCKSYMILNKNDYEDNSGGYVSGLLGRLSEANESLSDRVLHQDILDENGNPVPEVGFEALATYIGTKGNANNQEQLKAFVENYGTGYKKLWDIFSKTPVCKACGYTSLEDFIYDFDPEHFVANILEDIPDGFVAASDDDFGDSDDDNFLDDIDDSSNPAQMGNTPAPQFNNPAQMNNTPAPQPDNSEQVNNQAAQQAQAGTNSAPQFNNPAQMGTPAPQFNNPAQTNSWKPPYSPDVSDTRTMSAYGTAYTDELPIKPSDNPFVIYHNNGTVNNSLLRDTITNVLFKQIASIFGGLDAITEFTIQNNVVILNKTPFTPKLPEDILNSAPFVLRNQLAQGEYAQVLHFGYLKRLKNLLAINIDNQSLVDGFFWQDTIISPYKTKKLCKTWRRLQSFTVAGTDYIAKLSDDELQYSKAEQEAILEKKQARLDGFSRLKEGGKNVAGAFATALGLEPSSADKHPVLNRIGKSRPAKALRRGLGFTAAAYGASLLIGLANPFLILGGLFAVGSYISSRKTDKSK